MYCGKRDLMVIIQSYSLLGIIPKNRWVKSEYLMKHDIKALCYYLQKKL